MADDLDFAGQLDKWASDISNKIKLSAAQKAIINSAGAEVFYKVLREETPYNPHIRTDKHMRDTIVYQPGKNVDNLPNGDTDVGWDKDHAYIARIMNDGKKKMSAKEQAQLHFKDHAVEKARPLVEEAKARAYRMIMNGGNAHGNDSSTKSASDN